MHRQRAGNGAEVRTGPRDRGRVHQRGLPNRAGEMATSHPIPRSGREGGAGADEAGDRGHKIPCWRKEKRRWRKEGGWEEEKTSA